MVNAAGQALLRDNLVKGKRVYSLTADYLQTQLLTTSNAVIGQINTLTMEPIFDLRGHEHYKTGGHETVACCDFDFPGRKGMHARWDLGDDLVYISECDRDAWQAVKDAMRHND